MAKIILKGRLGKTFGEEWDMKISTIQESVRALDCNTDNAFSQYLLNIDKNLGVSYELLLNGQRIESVEESKMKVDENSVITFIPVLIGSIDPVSIIVQIVIAVVLAVISALLAPSPPVNLGSDSADARKESYLFNGTPTPAKQGMPVPLGYGIMKVFPIPASVVYQYENL